MANHPISDLPALPKYIPQLDGLRAIAIIGVMLFHHKVPGFIMGWAGVQLFFVISGFLITGILLDTKANFHYFRNFYTRRFLRIFPIYYLGLAIVILIAVIYNWGISDTGYYLFYVQNHHLALNNWKVNFPPLFDHTWSLAIEEQFYILWPLIIYALDVKKLKIVTIFLFVFACLVRTFLFLSGETSNLQFMLLPTQVDSLAAGAFLAIISREKNAQAKLSILSPRIMLVSGAALMALVLYARPHADWATASWADGRSGLVLFSLLSIFFASLISTAISSDSMLKGALSLPWLRGIGKISYGLYLYHYPIFIMADIIANENGNAEPNIQYRITNVIVTMVLTFLLAGLSWKWFEAPVLKYKDRFI